MREVITRFGRHNVGVLWLVGEPMIFTLGVAALWSAAGMSHGSGLPIIAFAITGYSSVLMWRNSVASHEQRDPAELRPLYHRNVQVIDVFVTRITARDRRRDRLLHRPGADLHSSAAGSSRRTTC